MPPHQPTSYTPPGTYELFALWIRYKLSATQEDHDPGSEQSPRPREPPTTQPGHPDKHPYEQQVGDGIGKIRPDLGGRAAHAMQDDIEHDRRADPRHR